jgi:hypothetical protein
MERDWGGAWAAKQKRDIHLDVDIITSDDRLPTDGDNLDFNVYDAKRLGADIDLDQAWIDCLVELTEA